MHAAGISTMIALQVIMNIAVVTSSMVWIAPFISAGGSSLFYTVVDRGFAQHIKKVIHKLELIYDEGDCYRRRYRGHIYPALAIADTLRSRIRTSILYVGTAGGLESRLVPERLRFRAIRVKVSAGSCR